MKVTAASLLPVSAALSAISAARQAARESALPDDFPGLAFFLSRLYAFLLSW